MKEKEITFDQAMEALKVLANKIKEPSLSLNESIKCYNDGIKYYELCKEELAKARKSFDIINVGDDHE